MLAGAFLFALGAPASRAAKVELGPLKVDTDPKPAEPAAVTTESASAEPHVVKSASPKSFQYGYARVTTVFHAKLEDVVDLGVGPYIERVLDAASGAGFAVVVLEIDTPGGRVDAAVQIKDALLASNVPTIAFIHRQAISAGALIALAHDYIVWSSGATMGAATPIQMDAEGGAEPVDEKMTSYMRGVMRSTAEAKGRDGLVAEAMVDREIDLPPYAPKGKLLTAAESQAEVLGLLDARAETFDELLVVCGLQDAEVVAPEVNWAEAIARFLTHPVTSSLLMSIGVLGLIIEFYTPGFGLAGIAGIVALLLFFGGHMVVRLAGLEEVLMFLIGMALILVEVLLIPGFGVAGIAGAALVIGGVVFALVERDAVVGWDWSVVGAACLQFLSALVAATVAAIFLLRYLPSVGPFRKLMLTTELSAKEGYVAGDLTIDQGLVGKNGPALTDLRPVGKARIADRLLDVSTQGDYIAKGTVVKVVAVDGQRIIVERT